MSAGDITNGLLCAVVFVLTVGVPIVCRDLLDVLTVLREIRDLLKPGVRNGSRVSPARTEPFDGDVLIEGALKADNVRSDEQPAPATTAPFTGFSSVSPIPYRYSMPAKHPEGGYRPTEPGCKTPPTGGSSVKPPTVSFAMPADVRTREKVDRFSEVILPARDPASYWR